MQDTCRCFDNVLGVSKRDRDINISTIRLNGKRRRASSGDYSPTLMSPPVLTITLPRSSWMCLPSSTNILSVTEEQVEWVPITTLPSQQGPLVFTYCHYQLAGTHVLAEFQQLDGTSLTVSVEASSVFHVKDKGWAALRPSVAAQKYSANIFLFLTPGTLQAVPKVVLIINNSKTFKNGSLLLAFGITTYLRDTNFIEMLTIYISNLRGCVSMCG